MIRARAAEFGLEEELVFAVVRAESNFRADAVSPAGAVGLMQLMPSTARFMQAMLGAFGEWREPQENIRLGRGICAICPIGSTAWRKFSPPTTRGRARCGAGFPIPPLVGADGELAHIPYPETRSYVRKTKIFIFVTNSFTDDLTFGSRYSKIILAVRWRNWQTRTFEGRMEKSVWVQVPFFTPKRSIATAMLFLFSAAAAGLSPPRAAKRSYNERRRSFVEILQKYSLPPIYMRGWLRFFSIRNICEFATDTRSLSVCGPLCSSARCAGWRRSSMR